MLETKTQNPPAEASTAATRVYILSLIFLPLLAAPILLQHTGLPVNLLDRETLGCQQLLWFTGISNLTPYSNDYEIFIKAALLSARANAPSLVPVLLYQGQPNDLTKWFEGNGGKVLFHRLPFLSDFASLPGAKPEQRDVLIQHEGVYLRLDIPVVIDALKAWGLVNMTNVSSTYALYTDSDVMFVGGDISTCSIPLPEQLSIGPELTRGKSENTGVLVFNMPEMKKELPQFIKYGRAHNFSFGAFDQGWIMDYKKDHNKSWALLADEMNWKAYWGGSPNATILHWHGPKPRRGWCIECFLKHSSKEGWEKQDGCGGCPPVYVDILNRAKTIDGGDMYARMLKEFERYAQQAAR